MSKTIENYALELAEDYVAWVIENDYYEEVITPESYLSARINNDMSLLSQKFIEAIEEMGV